MSVRHGLLTILALLGGGSAAQASCLDSLAAHREQTEADYLKSKDSPFDEKMRASKETYGGGRYLELYLPLGAHAALDFNRAYNPLCAYDAKFTCPMPTPENRLKIAVTAGEKAYAGKH